MQNTANLAFKTLEDLEAYQLAREFRKAMYAVSRRLPESEKYELASQISPARSGRSRRVARCEQLQGRAR